MLIYKTVVFLFYFFKLIILHVCFKSCKLLVNTLAFFYFFYFQTKSLVNIDSQFKKQFDLNNNNLSNEEDKSMKLNHRPLSVASPTNTSTKQSPILLAFHSVYLNKTSVELVQIKKGTKLKLVHLNSNSFEVFNLLFFFQIEIY